MPNNGYFDVERDIEIEKAGGFWCHGCLMGKPAIEQSPDDRHCQSCYEFLLKEVDMLPQGKRPAWIPKPGKSKIEHKKPIPVSQDVVLNMSTLESKYFEVDIIQPPGATRTSVKRGPKHRPLPEGLINLLAGEGLGSKAIAASLKAEFGITVSYKTIQRILSGERKQLVLPISET